MLTQIAKKHLGDWQKTQEENKENGNKFYAWMKNTLSQGETHDALAKDLELYLSNTLKSNWHKIGVYGGIKAKEDWCTNYDYHKFSHKIMQSKAYDLYAKMDADANWLIIFVVKNKELIKELSAYGKLAADEKNRILINYRLDNTARTPQTAINTPFGQMGVVAVLENIAFPHFENKHIVALRINMNQHFAKSLDRAGYAVTKSGNLLHFSIEK